MATLKVNTLTGTSTAGSIAVTGEGNSTTTNLQQGLSKAWLQGSSSAGRNDSLNIASGTDNGTGDYSYGLTNNFGGTAYVPSNLSLNASCYPSTCTATDADSFRVKHFNLSDVARDTSHSTNCVGDLA